MKSDIDKLLELAVEFGNMKDVFTSDMLYDYIISKNVKFHKDMNRKRIGNNLVKDKRFSVVKKTFINYYSLL